MPKTLTKDNTEFTYLEDEVNYSVLQEWYRRDVNDLGYYFDKCSKNYDFRRQYWAGKSDDLKKNQEDATPHQGASDTEVRLIEQMIRKGVSQEMNALQRSQIRAYPRGADDVDRAGEVSLLLKWFRDSGIPNFMREMELASNYGKEKGLMITYCGWKPNKKATRLRKISVEEVSDVIPQFTELFIDESREDQLFELLENVEGWELNKKTFRRAMKQFRNIGEASIPIVTNGISEADVQTFSPDSQVFLPSYTTDPQRASHINMRMLMTPQEVLNRVASEEWDAEWADYVIENHTGMSKSEFDGAEGFKGYSNYGSSRQYGTTTGNNARDIIEVIVTFQRLIDRDSNAEGIYYTVWHNDMGEIPGVPVVAKRELMDGRKDYPFVITPVSWDQKTLYDGVTWVEMLKAPQKTQKIIRDAWIDSTSDANNPPLIYPIQMGDLAGMGPGARVASRSMAGGQPYYLSKPDKFRQNLALEEYVQKEALELIGFNPEDPYSQGQNLFTINKFLHHAQNVLAMVYDIYSQEGEDELYFRVTGKPEPVQFLRNPNESTFDIQVSFNSTYNDPDKVEKLIDGLYKIKSQDPNGRVSDEVITDLALSALDPVAADMALVPAEMGSQKIIKETTDDIAKMNAGIPVGAPKGAAQLRLRTVQEYVNSEPGAAKLQNDPNFAFILSEYTKQLEFEMTQLENAEIGRIGTDPAQMGNINTQNLQYGT